MKKPRRIRSRRNPIESIAVMLVLAFGLTPSLAQARPSEYAVKAAYLLNFGKFVRWPQRNAGSFRICVLGSDPFGKMLDETVTGETIDGKSIAITRIDRASDAGSCHVLYISDSERGRVRAILAALRGQHVLTVSDLPGFVENGGDIGFVLQDDRVRFSVNLNAAQENGLSVSSDLLRVAIEVINKKSQG